MITSFSPKASDKNFYIPTVAGPEGKLPFAGTNYGEDTRVKSFKEFGEYRKGADKFGKVIERIMEFLRLPEFKNKLDDNDGIKFEIKDFESRSHINIEQIKQLLVSDSNLYSFDIKIDDKHIAFYNINKTKKERYVSGRKD